MRWEREECIAPISYFYYKTTPFLTANISIDSNKCVACPHIHAVFNQMHFLFRLEQKRKQNVGNTEKDVFSISTCNSNVKCWNKILSKPIYSFTHFCTNI